MSGFLGSVASEGHGLSACPYEGAKPTAALLDPFKTHLVSNGYLLVAQVLEMLSDPKIVPGIIPRIDIQMVHLGHIVTSDQFPDHSVGKEPASLERHPSIAETVRPTNERPSKSLVGNEPPDIGFEVIPRPDLPPQLSAQRVIAEARGEIFLAGEWDNHPKLDGGNRCQVQL